MRKQILKVSIYSIGGQGTVQNVICYPKGTDEDFVHFRKVLKSTSTQVTQYFLVHLCMKKVIIFAAFIAFFVAPVATKAQDFSENMEQLITWMSGEFNSAEQAKRDTAFMNISLKMTRVWKDKPNGAWFYVEQALASTPDAPYRQRMYFVSEIVEDEYSSDVYLLPNEKNYIGAWKNPELLGNLTPFELSHKSGCAVILFFDGFQYGGATSKGICKSELRGATYATSEVAILEDRIASWDRGFNSEDKQVWGSESGAYEFIKQR